MASEHTMSLKATLDTSDVQQKLNQVDQKAKNVGDVASASKDLNKLASSIKGLRTAIGGGVVVNSFANFAKNVKMFGDETDKMMQQVSSSFNRVMGAAQTGNVALIAFTATLEALGLAAQKYAQVEAEAAQNLTDLQDRVRKFKEFQRELEDYRLESRLENAGKMGQDEQRALKSELQDEYSELTNKVQDALQKGATLNAPETKGLVQRLRYLESAIDKLDKEIRGNTEVLDYNMNNESFSGPSGALSQSDEDELESAFQKLKWEKPDVVKTGANEYTQLLSLFGGGAMSGFSAAGFGMGEVSVTTTISRQIDQVIRLLQDQLRKDLMVVNTSDNTI